MTTYRRQFFLGVVALLLLVSVVSYAQQASEPVLVRFGVKSITTSTFTPSSASHVLNDPYTNALTPSAALDKLNNLAPIDMSSSAQNDKQTSLKHQSVDVLMVTLEYQHQIQSSTDFNVDGSFILSCPELTMELSSYNRDLYTLNHNDTSQSSSPLHLLSLLPGFMPAALSSPDLSRACPTETQLQRRACDIQARLPTKAGTLSPYAHSLAFVAPLKAFHREKGSEGRLTPLGAALDADRLVFTADGIHDSQHRYCSIQYTGKGLSLYQNSGNIQLSSKPIPLHTSSVNANPLIIPEKLSHSHNARISSSVSSRSASYISLRRQLYVGDAPGAPTDSLSNAIDEPVLMELYTNVGGFVPLVVKPAVGGLTKPVLDISSGMLMDAFVQHFVKKLYGTIITEVGTDVGLMLGHSLKANLTATVADALTFTLTESLQYNLVRVIAPIVSERVLQYAPEATSANLNRLLYDKISQHVIETTPELTARGLKMSLTHGLTRSITHSLVPVLTHSIGHHTNSDYYCHHCYYAGAKQSCALCHFSARSVYYQIYYGAYYADYYSKYYTGYYTQAVRRVDELTHKFYGNPGASILPQTKKYLEKAGRPVAVESGSA